MEQMRMVMMGRIILKGDGELQVKLSNAQSKMLTRTIMGKTAGRAVTLIFKRTVQKGQDRTGKPFKKYSRSYLKTKKERGGKFFSNSPNLFDGGDMMGDLSFSVESSSRAFLNFPKTGESLKASGHIHGSRRLPKRDFFGLTTAEERAVLLIPKSHIERIINAAN
jgi:hypothetical protein